MTTTPELISAAQLAAALSSDTGLVLLDVRHTPGKTDGRERYLAGHIPGARYVDLPTQLADAGAVGKGPGALPSIDALQRDARGWGIRADSRVVVYDDTSGGPAARAWWVLRWAGLRNIAFLDGGFKAWTAAGRPVDTGEAAAPAPGDVVLGAGGALPSIDADDALATGRGGVLIDARPAPSYSDPQNPASGHIPGAVSLPISRFVDEQGRLLPAPQLRERLAEVGSLDAALSGQPVAAYCGSGVAAAFTVLALGTAGIPAALYPGSWSEWILDSARPVQR